ncbi:MAG TPA: ribosome-associated translation inhibitor RaiA [Burkholderiales bacterium]|nr:ribosome-associated translation inhibitor RaiA [Burkholderiales bacterium]
MNLHLTGHHLEITPAIRDYVSSKLLRITHHFDHVIDVSVVLTVEKLRRRIEASVHVRGRDIFCENADADMYAAIDGLVDKLDRTIIKHKEKTRSKRHDGASLKHPDTE